MKVCIKCNIEKSYDDFYKRKDSKDGYRLDCKDCNLNKTKRWKDKNYLKVRADSFNSASGRVNTSSYNAMVRDGKIPKEKLMQLYEENKSCNYCKIKLDEKEFVFEHMQPLSRNGSHNIENVCISCKDCNDLKGLRNYEEFMSFVKVYITRFR